MGQILGLLFLFFNTASHVTLHTSVQPSVLNAAPPVGSEKPANFKKNDFCANRNGSGGSPSEGPV